MVQCALYSDSINCSIKGLFCFTNGSRKRNKQEENQGETKKKRKPMEYKEEYVQISPVGRHWLEAKVKQGMTMVWLVG